MALLTVTSAGTPVIAVVAVDGKWWNTSGSPAFETYNAANIASYATAGTQFGSTTAWKITFPAGIAAGVYDVVQFKRAGGSLAETDTVEAVGSFSWDGTTLRAVSDADLVSAKIGTPANIDGGGATIADNLKKLADDNGGATFDATNDSLNKIAAGGDTGITLAKALEMLAAFMAGKVSVSSAGGVSTYTYKKRDGSTTSFTSECSETDGTRATTGSLS